MSVVTLSVPLYWLFKHTSQAGKRKVSQFYTKKNFSYTNKHVLLCVLYTYLVCPNSARQDSQFLLLINPKNLLVLSFSLLLPVKPYAYCVYTNLSYFPFKLLCLHFLNLECLFPVSTFVNCHFGQRGFSAFF